MLLLAVPTGWADIYVYRDARGIMHFTEIPTKPKDSAAPKPYPPFRLLPPYRAALDRAALQQALVDGLGQVKLEELSITGADRISVKVNTGAWLGFWQGSELEKNMYHVVYAARKVVDIFPGIREILVEVVAPAERSHDEYGNELPESEASLVTLIIDCNDLRKFKIENVNANTAVYVANRYLRDISQVNWHLRKDWQAKLSEETERLNIKSRD